MNDNDGDLRVRQDWKLIRLYVDQGSQAAFASLTAQYIDLVYTVCLRETGAPEMAEDAAQAVFLVLAKKMKAFRPGIILSTWLFTVSRLTCKNALRDKRVQTLREKAAEEVLMQSSAENEKWREIEPFLHDAIASLNHRERDLILLRFFEGQSFPEVGSALGLSEDAARMRMNRAIEKLRRRLVQQGILVAAATLVELLADHSVQAAPTILAGKVLAQNASIGSAAGASIHFLAKGVLKTMTLIKWTTAAMTAFTGISGVALVASVGGHALHFNNTISAPTAPLNGIAGESAEIRVKAADNMQAMGIMTRDNYLKLHAILQSGGSISDSDLEWALALVRHPLTQSQSSFANSNILSILSGVKNPPPAQEAKLYNLAVSLIDKSSAQTDPYNLDIGSSCRLLGALHDKRAIPLLQSLENDPRHFVSAVAKRYLKILMQ